MERVSNQKAYRKRGIGEAWIFTTNSRRIYCTVKIRGCSFSIDCHKEQKERTTIGGCKESVLNEGCHLLLSSLLSSSPSNTLAGSSHSPQALSLSLSFSPPSAFPSPQALLSSLSRAINNVRHRRSRRLRNVTRRSFRRRCATFLSYTSCIIGSINTHGAVRFVRYVRLLECYTPLFSG